jgi:hypothetical protein
MCSAQHSVGVEFMLYFPILKPALTDSLHAVTACCTVQFNQLKNGQA